MDSISGIKDLGNDLYELNAPCAFYILFQVLEILPVGEVVSGQYGQEIASCVTECQSVSISVDFTCKIVEINQPFIDCLRATEGKDFELQGFKQTDWICRVQKVSYTENKYGYFGEHKQYKQLPPTVFPNTWLKYLKPYLFELGYFDNCLPLEYYVRNFQILGAHIKKRERICSFEYFPNHFGLGEKKWELAEKNQQTAYLYAPYDIENITFNEKLLMEVQYNPQPNGWILMNIKKDFILTIERKVNYYRDYWCWYKYEGDLIRIGLDTENDEYMRIHQPIFPMNCASVGKIFKVEDIPTNEYIFEIDVNGPIGRWYTAAFDMEIMARNPIVWNDLQLNNPCEILSTDPYNEGWIMLVKPLNPEKTKEMFAEWREKGRFE